MVILLSYQYYLMGQRIACNPGTCSPRMEHTDLVHEENGLVCLRGVLPDSRADGGVHTYATSSSHFECLHYPRIDGDSVHKKDQLW